MGKPITMGERLLQGYLQRRVDALQNVIDTKPMFSKQYDDAVIELEEIEEIAAERSAPTGG